MNCYQSSLKFYIGFKKYVKVSKITKSSGVRDIRRSNRVGILLNFDGFFKVIPVLALQAGTKTDRKLTSDTNPDAQ